VGKNSKKRKKEKREENRIPKLTERDWHNVAFEWTQEDIKSYNGNSQEYYKTLEKFERNRDK